MTENDIQKVKEINGVVNFLYWLGEPAKIAEAEIQAIKEFSEYYQEIKIEKLGVDFTSEVKFTDDPIYSRDGNFISVKSKSVKLSLPSLGYRLVAENRRPRPIVVESPVWNFENITAKFPFFRFLTLNS